MSDLDKLLAMANKLFPSSKFNRIRDAHYEGENGPNWIEIERAKKDGTRINALYVPLWPTTSMDLEKSKPRTERDDPRRAQLHTAAVLLGLLEP